MSTAPLFECPSCSEPAMTAVSLDMPGVSIAEVLWHDDPEIAGVAVVTICGHCRSPIRIVRGPIPGTIVPELLEGEEAAEVLAQPSIDQLGAAYDELGPDGGAAALSVLAPEYRTMGSGGGLLCAAVNTPGVIAKLRAFDVVAAFGPAAGIAFGLFLEDEPWIQELRSDDHETRWPAAVNMARLLAEANRERGFVTRLVTLEPYTDPDVLAAQPMTPDVLVAPCERMRHNPDLVAVIFAAVAIPMWALSVRDGL